MTGRERVAISNSSPFVHETAIVEPGATVGSGTRIWHHAHVRSGGRVGVDCVIGKGVYVDEGADVGDRVKLENYVSVFRGVTIEDEVFVGPSATFTNDRVPRATSVEWEVVRTRVRRGASIGANATIVCGVEIGAFALVAAGAVVTRSVEDHEVVAGNPARRVGWVCDCGRQITHAQERPSELRCERCPPDGGP